MGGNRLSTDLVDLDEWRISSTNRLKKRLILERDISHNIDETHDATPETGSRPALSVETPGRRAAHDTAVRVRQDHDVLAGIVQEREQDLIADKGNVVGAAGRCRVFSPRRWVAAGIGGGMRHEAGGVQVLGQFVKAGWGAEGAGHDDDLWFVGHFLQFLGGNTASRMCKSVD